MKKNQLTETKGLEISGLILKIKKTREELTDLVIDKSSKQLKDTNAFFKKRKDLAQLLTILRQKQLLSETEKNLNQNKEVGEEKGESNL